MATREGVECNLNARAAGRPQMGIKVNRCLRVMIGACRMPASVDGATSRHIIRRGSGNVAGDSRVGCLKQAVVHVGGECSSSSRSHMRATVAAYAAFKAVVTARQGRQLREGHALLTVASIHFGHMASM